MVLHVGRELPKSRRRGLTAQMGVILGRLERNYLRHNGTEQIPCFAPTWSGKGVGLVVPTLLTSPGSRIVHDVKGENWDLTSGFRARHGNVLLFDPTNRDFAAHNPPEVRRGEWGKFATSRMADVLVDPEGRRLDRLARRLERVERHVTISNEALALFVRFWLTALPTARCSARSCGASTKPSGNPSYAQEARLPNPRAGYRRDQAAGAPQGAIKVKIEANFVMRMLCNTSSVTRQANSLG
jgi:hypothetical protein